MKATADTKPEKKRQTVSSSQCFLDSASDNMSLHRVREAFGIFNSEEGDIGTLAKVLHSTACRVPPEGSGLPGCMRSRPERSTNAELSSPRETLS